MTGSPARARSAGRVPALDGVRAIAILLVLFGHYAGPEFAARVGVHLFFLLSGYLITGILVRELRATGRISLRQFYFRRACRILPAYVLWLSVTWLVISPGPSEYGTLLSLGTFTTNYWHIFGITGSEPSWSFVAMTVHAWSLAVEEQFYLLWPLALGAIGLVRASRVLLSISILMLSWTIGAAMLGAGEQYLSRAFEVEGVWLALGCFAAVKWGDVQWKSRALSSRALGGIGIISYPLYLWHYWGAWASFTFAPSVLPDAVRIPYAIGLTTLFACASYFLVERPVMRWRDRVAKRAGPRLARSTADDALPNSISAGTPADA